jgi:hypothetical protein
MYKIFDTIKTFNIKNQEINKALGYATADSIPLRLMAVEDGQYLTDGIAVLALDDIRVQCVDGAWSTKPSIQTYAEPILLADGKFAMQILPDVAHLFNAGELVENIVLKMEK